MKEKPEGIHQPSRGTAGDVYSDHSQVAWAAKIQLLVSRKSLWNPDPFAECRCCSGCHEQNAKSLLSAANCQRHHDGYETG